ncbi:N-acetylmuramoyl-L-alanine amidase [Sporosarcina sp. FSL K6-1540]|uniref:peptidoglycan recognition protein family protein n=1 Tax=Sporosarcina sp. FSL K6-1540 TaxID=2921555 RepID=UPI00315A580A
MSYTIINIFIPATLYPLKAPYAMMPEYITIHNTYNDATAANEIAYMTRNTNPVSYHVAIDDKQALQAIPFTRNAFHAGDGLGKGNRASIGIEICYSKSGGPKYVAAEENTVEYVAHLLKQYGWGIDRVKWHRDWSGKNCPHRIIDEGRTKSVKDRIASKLKELNNPTPPKEEIRMFKPSSATLKAAYEQFLTGAIKDGTIAAKWLTDFKANKLSLDDALALKVIVDQREK